MLLTSLLVFLVVAIVIAARRPNHAAVSDLGRMSDQWLAEQRRNDGDSR